MRPPSNRVPPYLAALTFAMNLLLAGAAVAEQPPVVTAPASVSSPEITAINFTVTAVDPDADTITSLLASGSAMSAGATFTSNATHTSGSFSWTPTFSQAGSYNVTFT